MTDTLKAIPHRTNVNNRPLITTAAEQVIRDATAKKIDDALFPAPAAPPAPRHGATFTLHALIDDFPFDVSFVGTADQLAATVDRLRAIGAVPPTQAARAAVEAEKARSAPVCEFHGAMKESTKAPGTFFCPQKMGDGSYCKSKG